MFFRTFINDAGSLSALPSQTTVPSVLTMQIDTVFSDTSNPTKSAIALLPLLLGRINPSSRVAEAGIGLPQLASPSLPVPAMSLTSGSSRYSVYVL